MVSVLNTPVDLITTGWLNLYNQQNRCVLPVVKGFWLSKSQMISCRRSCLPWKHLDPNRRFVKQTTTLLGTNISNLWNRTIIFPATFKWDMISWFPGGSTFASWLVQDHLLNTLQKPPIQIETRLIFSWQRSCSCTFIRQLSKHWG